MTIRVLTANLCRGRADPAALAALVEELAVDLAALQEAAPASLAGLSRFLPHAELDAAPTSGMAIAARRPVQTGRIPLPYRDAMVAWLDPSGWPGLGAPLEVINVHVLSPLQRRSRAVRRGQLAGLERHLDESAEEGRVLLGDLNATPVWPLYRRLARRLADAAAETAAGGAGRAARTWGPGPGSARLLRIDHVLVENVKVVETRVIPIPGSDHSGLVVELAG